MSPADEAAEDRRREALEHLQVAALEFIEAARAMLDVAEEAVREPGGLATIVSETLGGLAAAFGVGVRPESPEAEPADGGAPRRTAGIERIRVAEGRVSEGRVS